MVFFFTLLDSNEYQFLGITMIMYVYHVLIIGCVFYTLYPVSVCSCIGHASHMHIRCTFAAHTLTFDMFCIHSGTQLCLDQRGQWPPQPNEKKQNIKYIKLGFEFLCSIFVQYFPAFTKDTLSLFKFLLNFDSFCEFLFGF